MLFLVVGNFDVALRSSMGLEVNVVFMFFLVVGNLGVAVVCVRKDGEFLLLDNPGEVLCKWLVENIDESGRPITEERDFKAMVLFHHRRELHKLLEDAKAARDNTCFLLNGVNEILFSPKELAAAKGVTKARAGTAALDEEKIDALFGKKH
ncbi:hypothetical protein NDU88_003198 [Pleurodeles waltl]|uniref:Uncharacterized protein n=1 Tax=Pleurodeles waltl TaxID=8319 RepID=A0AAV7W2T5_PLEWA|nr:hypothetical protein NDU88_003198 [Pleurodeles waltl]